MTPERENRDKAPYVASTPRKPSQDPYRKAGFREQAREIVARDRNDRKYGYAVDTSGAIARALEKAYRQGFNDAQTEPAPDSRPTALASGPIDWVLIPPRFRDGFWRICLHALGREPSVRVGAYLAPSLGGRGAAAWSVVRSNGHETTPVGAKTVEGLVRLGLLALSPEAADRIVVSRRGEATWKWFLDRGGQYPEDLT